jgi:hypothetical protein
METMQFTHVGAEEMVNHSAASRQPGAEYSASHEALGICFLGLSNFHAMGAVATDAIANSVALV